MLRKSFIGFLSAAFLTSVVSADTSPLASAEFADSEPTTSHNDSQRLSPVEAAYRGTLSYLASDELRGRLPGTPGYEKAAAFTAQQMKEAGLQPGGDDGGWYQLVPLVATESSGAPEMTIDGKPLGFDIDFAVWPTPGGTTVELDAPVVFAGYGVVDPVAGRDDYFGLDVQGKIVALFASGPKNVDADVAAGMTWYLDRTKTAKDHGAIGVIYLHTGEWERTLPFKFIAPIFASSQTTWSDSKGTPDLGAPRLGILSASGAAQLFSNYSIGWDAIRAAEDEGKSVPLGPTNARLTTKQQYKTTHVNSMNVIGRLPGSDPALAVETIVMTAHLDHVGTIAPVKGDDIANGAIDNAIGVAMVLETAKHFKTNGDRPKRTILFIALTGEESGLTGSDYFVNHTTVPADKIVANINVDAPALTYTFQGVNVVGLDRSSIGAVARTAIEQEGFEVEPARTAFFTRSDHYNFAKIGVPVIALVPGSKNGGKEAYAEYWKRYHTPFDDMSQPFDWTAGIAFANLNYLIIRDLANAPDRPRWVKGDYFGTRFKGPMDDQ